MTTTALEFLSGKEAPGGLTRSWVLDAPHEELERRHDWIQWAFPNDVPSSFNPDAPILSPEEIQSITPKHRQILGIFTTIYMDFMVQTVHWRHPGDHNHMRITRIIRCLTLAGMGDEAFAVYTLAMKFGSPAETTKRFWYDALPEDRRPK